MGCFITATIGAIDSGRHYRRYYEQTTQWQIGMERDLLVDILSIIVPVLIAAGAGGIALWRQMQLEEKHKQALEVATRRSGNDYRLKADKAAFDRARATIESLDKRLAALEAKARECFDTLERIEKENGELRQEVIRLRAGG